MRSAAAVSSCGSAATPRSSRKRFSIRCMKKFAADERVPRQPSRGSPKTRVIGTGSCDDRHVAGLAALRVLVVAVQPFLIGHLLRQTADRLPAGTRGFR